MAVKGFCEDCQATQYITCTGKQQVPGSKWSSQWWTFDMHKYPDKQEICPGSGKQI